MSPRGMSPFGVSPVKGGARRFAASGERSKPKEWERSRADSSHGEPRTEPPSEAAEPIPAREKERAMKEVVITGAARTAAGSFLGSLADIPAPKLGAIAIAEAVSRSGIGKEEVEQVIMGNVLPAGVGRAPARQAGVFAGIPVSAGGRRTA